MRILYYLLFAALLITAACQHGWDSDQSEQKPDANGNELSKDSALSLAKTITHVYPDSAIKTLKRYLPASANLSDDEIWRKNDIIASAFIDLGKYDSAMLYAAENLKHYTNPGQEANTYIMLGNAYGYLPGGSSKSLEFYLKAADKCKTTKDSIALYRSYINLAFLYVELGAPEKAAPYALEANKYHEKKGIIQGLAHSQSSLGRLYNIMEDYDKALNFEFAALESFKSLEHTQAIISSYINIGNNLGMKNEHEQRLAYMDSALALNSGTLKSNYFASVCKTNIATTFYSLNRFEECDAMADSILALMHNSNNSSRYGRVLSTKAEANIALGKFDTAKYYLEKSVEIAKNNDDLQGEYIVYSFSRILYEKQKNYKLALEYYAKAIEIDKTIRSKEKETEVKNLAIVYETEKKNQTIAFQEKEIENKDLTLRNQQVKFWFLLSTLLLIIIIFATIFIYQRKMHKRKAEAEQSRKEKEIARYKLQVVNNQISPHFTFNAVNSLKGLIAGEKKEAALEAFSKFSKLINATLTASDSFTNTIAEEMKFIDLFLDFRKFRYEDKFEYQINVADDVDMDFVILRLSVQELVENAIKHGIRHKTTNDGLIKVEVLRDSNYYIFSVSDNGIGREKAQKLHTTGTGKGAYIQNMMNNILNTNNSSPSNIYHTDLFDDEGKASGTHATLKIPIDYKYEL